MSIRAMVEVDFYNLIQNRSGRCAGCECKVRLQDEMSGADIKAACTEAGLLALREKVLYKKKEGVPEGMYM